MRSTHNSIGRRRAMLAAAIAAMCATPALAMQLDDGTGDLTIRWDNTLKYNLMNRVQNQDNRILESSKPGDNPSAFDDSDLGFGTGVVSNRFDLLSELDVSWRQQFGFRVSAAGWWDLAYGDDTDANGLNCEYFALSANPHNPNCADTWGLLSQKPGELNRAARDQAYRDAEVLDAFVYGNFNFGDTGVSVRLGRHTIYWGNSLFVAGAVHGIAGAMAPIDLAKGFGVPGSEAKELFLPTNKLSTSIQLTSSLSLVGFYSFEWEPTRLPAVGTYLSLGEVTTDDAEFLTLVPGQYDPVTGAAVPRQVRQGFVQNESERPDDGEWGIGTQYTFENGLELGVYYINYHDKYPQGLVGAVNYPQFVSSNVFRALGLPPTAVAGLWPAGAYYEAFGAFNDGVRDAHGVGRFKWTYREDNDLFGISLAKEIAGISVGSDLVYRKDVAISVASGPALLNVQHYARFTCPPSPAIACALQAQIDRGLAGLGANIAVDYDFDAADESNYPGPTGDTAHFVLNGLGFLNPGRLWDGGTYSAEFTASVLMSYGDHEELASKYIDEDDIATTIGVSFSPQWFQVIPSLDLRMPMNVSYGIHGHSPLSVGGDQSLGNGSIGLAFEYEQVWLVDTKYNFFFGDQDRGSAGQLVDRDNVTLTVKRTF